MQLKEEIKKIMNNVFGFMVNQPLHYTLRQMRFIHVGLLASSQWLLWEIIQSLKATDPVQAAIAYGAIAATLIATIWKSIDGINQSTHKDDKD